MHLFHLECPCNKAFLVLLIDRLSPPSPVDRCSQQMAQRLQGMRVAPARSEREHPALAPRFSSHRTSDHSLPALSPPATDCVLPPPASAQLSSARRVLLATGVGEGQAAVAREEEREESEREGREVNEGGRTREEAPASSVQPTTRRPPSVCCTCISGLTRAALAFHLRLQGKRGPLHRLTRIQCEKDAAFERRCLPQAPSACERGSKC